MYSIFKPEKEENTEQTEITEQTESGFGKAFPFVPLFPSVPYSIFCCVIIINLTAPMPGMNCRIRNSEVSLS